MGRQTLWDLKHAPGGVLELETLAQGLMVANAHRHPQILKTHTTQAFLALHKAGVIPDHAADELTRISLFYRNVNGIKRLCLDTDSRSPQKWPRSLKHTLAEAGETGSFEALEVLLRKSQIAVSGVYRDLIEAEAS